MLATCDIAYHIGYKHNHIIRYIVIIMINNMLFLNNK